jgi:tetraacyldisaccharide 4'-kinase
MINFLLSGIYGLLVRSRLLLYGTGLKKSARLDKPVISVGNIVLGGTGKTPFTIYICRMLLEAGLKPAILSRGYRGTAEKRNLLISNGREILSTPSESGDEPWLMADKLPGIPVAVGGKRYESARLCQAELNMDPGVFILDDGFQHIQLHRDTNILLIDATSPFGGDHLLPRGILREPLGELKRADAFVITRAHLEGEELERISGRLSRYNPLAPVFFYSHRISGFKKIKRTGSTGGDGKENPLEQVIPGKNSFILAAIGNPLQFIRDLENLDLNISGQILMRDHHPFSQDELDIAVAEFKDSGADFMVTTEKDAVRMGHLNLDGVPLYSAGLEVYSRDEERFRQWLLNRISSFSPEPD